jgi:uncharacterized membrane protein
LNRLNSLHRSAKHIPLAMLLIGLSLVAGLFAAPPVSHAAQDNRALYWEEYNVTISEIDTTANRFHVQETHKLRISTGPFNGGDRKIPLSRVGSIENIRVTDGGRELSSVNRSAKNCGTQRGIVCLSTQNGERVIYYNFFERADSRSTRTIVYDYDVVGGLRSYPEGDWFSWKMLAEERPFPIQRSTVTVELPPDFAVKQTFTFPNTWTRSESDNSIIYQSPGNPGDSGFEVQIQYPHNPAMPPPSWQANFDRGNAIAPFANIGTLALAGLVAIFGPFLIYNRYAKHKRGIAPAVVPEYLSEPPGDLPASVVGTLIDGSAYTKDVMAALLDLARRGYIVIEQREESGFLGIGTTQQFTFHRTDKPESDLRLFERTMLYGLFRGGQTDTDLSELRNVFYKTVNSMKTQLYDEVVHEKFYRQSPNAIRGGWIAGGIALIVLGIGGAVFFFGQDEIPPWLALTPLIFGALAFVGTIMALVSGAMASRTAKGEQEAAKWKAFRNYLNNIRKYSSLEEAAARFEQNLPYAVTFGLEREYISELSRVMTSFPRWYYYDPMYGPWRPGYGNWNGGSSGGGWSDVAGSGGNFGGGLNQMSSNMSAGLVAMSGGLTTMLNTAGAVMTSQPSSSGGGGGGFSGGGGGGGSAGFH